MCSLPRIGGLGRWRSLPERESWRGLGGGGDQEFENEIDCEMLVLRDVSPPVVESDMKPDMSFEIVDLISAGYY